MSNEFDFSGSSFLDSLQGAEPAPTSTSSTSIADKNELQSEQAPSTIGNTEEVTTVNTAENASSAVVITESTIQNFEQNLPQKEILRESVSGIEIDTTTVDSVSSHETTSLHEGEPELTSTVSSTSVSPITSQHANPFLQNGSEGSSFAELLKGSNTLVNETQNISGNGSDFQKIITSQSYQELSVSSITNQTSTSSIYTDNTQIRTTTYSNGEMNQLGSHVTKTQIITQPQSISQSLSQTNLQNFPQTNQLSLPQTQQFTHQPIQNQPQFSIQGQSHNVIQNNQFHQLPVQPNSNNSLNSTPNFLDQGNHSLNRSTNNLLGNSFTNNQIPKNNSFNDLNNSSFMNTYQDVAPQNSVGSNRPDIQHQRTSSASTPIFYSSQQYPQFSPSNSNSSTPQPQPQSQLQHQPQTHTPQLSSAHSSPQPLQRQNSYISNQQYNSEYPYQQNQLNASPFQGINQGQAFQNQQNQQNQILNQQGYFPYQNQSLQQNQYQNQFTPAYQDSNAYQYSNSNPLLYPPNQASHIRQSSSEFAFDVTTLPNKMMQDQFHNFSKTLPRPIVNCGFGGKLVVMFPKRAMRLNNNVPEHELPFSQNSEIKIYNLSKVLKENEYMRALTQYPGVFSNTQKDSIISYINQIVLQYDRIVSIMGKSLSPENLIEKQIWELLRVFISLDKLTEDSIEDALHQVKLILLQQKDQTIQNNSLNQWQNEQTFNENQLNTFESMHLNPNVPTPQQQLQYIQQVQKLLIEGRIEQACDVACSGHLWGHALLLASMIDKATYTKVVTLFASESFSDGSPLKSLYLMFADRGDLLFQNNLYTQNFQNLQQNSQRQNSVNQLCKNWRENLAILIANRTSSSGEIIEKLGDALWKENNLVHCSHFCYLIGDFLSRKNHVPSIVALIGANHRKKTPGSRPFLDACSIQRTEIYFYFLKLHNPNIVPTTLIAFRLLYAYMLAEAGFLPLATKYVIDLQQQVNQLREKSFNFSSYFLHQLNVLEDRLKGSGEMKKTSGVSIFSSLFSKVDSTINSMMSSDPESPKPNKSSPAPSVPSTPKQSNPESNDTNNSGNKSWLGSWFGKKKKGANLGTGNTRKWSDKLQRYIPIDADENTFVDQRDEPPPPSINDISELSSTPTSTTSATSTPVFNSMTSRKYGGYASYGSVPTYFSPMNSLQPQQPQQLQQPQQPQQPIPYQPQQQPMRPAFQSYNQTPTQAFQPNSNPNPSPIQLDQYTSQEAHQNESIEAPATYLSQSQSLNQLPIQPNQSNQLNQPIQPIQQQPMRPAFQPYIPPAQVFQPTFQPNPSPNPQDQISQDAPQNDPNEYTYGWSEVQWGDGDMRISSGYGPEETNNKQ